MDVSSYRWRAGALVAAVVLGVAGCGSGDGPSTVAAGQAPPTASAPADPEAPPVSEATPPEASPPEGAQPDPDDPASDPTPTTTVAPEGGDLGASPVEGLAADELLAAVTAPLPEVARRSSGPTADRVTLADGTTVWRVRIPGPTPARSARVTVAVGDREVGPGVPPPDLGALVAVTTDGTGLVAGAPVTYQWEGSEPVSAGALEVVR